VVEDEGVLADSIARGLRWEGMAIDVSQDGADALDKLAVSSYDVIVLDRDLPVVSGDELCRRLATDPERARILMLTAARAVTDRIDRLNLGADDHLPKPFAFGELVARIWALVRRPGPARPPVLAAGDVVVDPPDAWPSATAGAWTCPAKSSASWRCCWPRVGRWSAPRSCWSGSGTSTPTRSRPPCA
jgi:DNA-binding response OmpR family regulator